MIMLPFLLSLLTLLLLLPSHLLLRGDNEYMRASALHRVHRRHHRSHMYTSLSLSAGHISPSAAAMTDVVAATCTDGAAAQVFSLIPILLRYSAPLCARRDSIFPPSPQAIDVSLARSSWCSGCFILPSFYMSNILAQFEPLSPPRLHPITFYHSDVPSLAAGSSLAYPRLLHVNKQYFACK